MAIVTETETLFAGCVLKVSHHESYQVMSDIWGSCSKVLVWDHDANKPVTHSYNFSDMGQVWSKAKIEIDATEEVKDKYRKHLIEVRKQKLVDAAVTSAAKINKGNMVEVVRGRKVKAGTKGKVIAMIWANYGMGYRSKQMMKCGIALDDEMEYVIGKNGKGYDRHKNVAWVWEMYCERLDKDPINVYEIEKQAVSEIDQEMKRM